MLTPKFVNIFARTTRARHERTVHRTGVVVQILPEQVRCVDGNGRPWVFDKSYLQYNNLDYYVVFTGHAQQLAEWW